MTFWQGNLFFKVFPIFTFSWIGSYITFVEYWTNSHVWPLKITVIWKCSDIGFNLNISWFAYILLWEHICNKSTPQLFQNELQIIHYVWGICDFWHLLSTCKMWIPITYLTWAHCALNGGCKVLLGINIRELVIHLTPNYWQFFYV